MFRTPIWMVMIVLILVAMACRAASPSGSAEEIGEVSGEQVFQSSGCSGCHNGPAGIAPSLNGVYGAQVALENGETVTADEEYLRESILSPQSKLVSGYQPIMPDFQGKLSAEEVEALVEYIRSLEE